jgi:GNAT superfamily N-acetyltransferase
MKTESLNISDLKRLTDLQPSDWPDIIPYFYFYLNSDYCDPIKVEVDNSIVGIGTSIKHKESAWLAHIIVHPEYRCRGIGTEITNTLVNKLKMQRFNTIFLIATNLGEPLYRKTGFEKETEYLFFKEGKYSDNTKGSDKIVPYNEKHGQNLLALDKKVSGEKREVLLISHLPNTVLAKTGNKVNGFYMPTLGEGLIVASDPEAGIELMKVKYSTVSKAILPMENKTGIEFHLKNGFTEYLKGTRMRYGKEIIWHPEMLYSRIGGNLG